MKVLNKISLFALSILALSSCKKEYETPPVKYPEEGSVITIDSLRNLQQKVISKSFTQDVSVYGIITMDETDGNLYKNVFMQDHTGAINVRLLSGGGIYQGDSVRIALKGTYINQFSGVLQLDSVDADVNVIKQSVGNNFPPEVTTIDEITTAKESQLIRLENVQFVEWQLDKTFADAENLESKDRFLEDEDGNVIVVRTSGYASFAGEPIPTGSGSLNLIVNHFNGEIQLLIRSYAEINMNNPRFSGLKLRKDFNDDLIVSDGWSLQQVTGTDVWETSTAGGAPDPYAVISNYDGMDNYTTECWMISPSIDLTGAGSPYMAFDNAKNYFGDDLEVLVSTDYVSGDPSTGSWSSLSPILSGGSWVWVNSGNLDLTPYIGSNVHIAFKYTGSNSDGATWEIDNIIIKG